MFLVLFHSKTYCCVMVYAPPTGWVCKPRLCGLWLGVSKVLHNSRSICSLRAGDFTTKYPIKRRNRLFSVLFHSKTFYSVMVYVLPTSWVCKLRLCELWLGVSKVLHNSRSIRSLRAAAFTVKYPIKWRNRLFSGTFLLENILQRHGVCPAHELGVQIAFMWVVVECFEGSTQFPEHT